VVTDVTRAADIYQQSSAVLFKKGRASAERVDVNELIRGNDRHAAERSETPLHLCAPSSIRIFPRSWRSVSNCSRCSMNLMLNGIDAMKDTSGQTNFDHHIRKPTARTW